MIELNPAPQSTLEFTRNFASVPLAVGRKAVNEAGVYLYARRESITDSFKPLEGSENPQIIKADE